MSPRESGDTTHSVPEDCFDRDFFEDLMVSHTMMRLFIKSKNLCSEYLSWKSSANDGL